MGFSIRHIDTSERADVMPTGTPGQELRGGCRVVVTCTKSGLRAVLETVGEECGCSEQHLTMEADGKTVCVYMKSHPPEMSTIEYITSIHASSLNASIVLFMYFSIKWKYFTPVSLLKYSYITVYLFLPAFRRVLYC